MSKHGINSTTLARDLYFRENKNAVAFAPTHIHVHVHAHFCVSRQTKLVKKKYERDLVGVFVLISFVMLEIALRTIISCHTMTK